MMCQFVFPKAIERPFKGDLKDMELVEVEDLELEQKLEDEYEMKIKLPKKAEDIKRLKEELKEEKRKLRKTDKEYEKRLLKALNDLDKRREEFLVVGEENS